MARGFVNIWDQTEKEEFLNKNVQEKVDEVKSPTDQTYKVVTKNGEIITIIASYDRTDEDYEESNCPTVRFYNKDGKLVAMFMLKNIAGWFVYDNGHSTDIWDYPGNIRKEN